MTNLVGRTLSHYRVTSAIGAGGMGEVYRATDTTLGRDVAIKVLPPDVAGDPERLSRFRREAHLLASLNHPNIAAIYGLEEADGTPFLALELVEGEDLRERLARGAIPVDEAIDIATEIAEALEEAHNKGIVHRDLKPANVKLASDGRVKVLDFGLAKAWAGDASGVGSSPPVVTQSPTRANDGTLAGVVLGTASYMAPEQARGKVVDKRADIWAFGVLLWEILTGRSMFAGETVTDVIAAVVTREPDLAALPAATPPAVRRLIGRCLRKDPRQRLPDIGSARLELQEVRSGTAPAEAATSAVPAATGPAVRRGERLGWAAFGLVAAGLAAALAFVHFREAAPPRPIAARFTVDPPPGWEFDTTFGWPAPSPDGRQIVFQARRPSQADATSMLWIRPLESLASRPLAGTEGGYLPAWSPDGTSLAFAAGREVRRLSLADGTVQRVCTIPVQGEGGIDWSDSGTILFSSGGGTGLIYSVPATGGDARPLTTLNKATDELNHHMPQFLPSGDRFLFMVGTTKDGGVYVSSLATPAERRLVLPGWRRAVYASGHLLFARDGTLLAQPFDAAVATLSGEPVAIATSVAGWTVTSALAWFSASPSGTLAYYSGPRAGLPFQLAWVDRKGALINKIGDPGDFSQFTVSPDGRSVAVEVRSADGQYDLWVMDVNRGVLSRVTASPANERDPVWAPDGLSLAFAVRSDKGDTLVRKGLRATDPEVVIDPGFAERAIPEYWLPDGESLLVIRRNEQKGEQPSVWALPLKGGKGEQVISGVLLDEPQVSPDGRWLSYSASESGQDEVYVEPFRRQGARVRVSTKGGGQPKWRADGRELFFVSSDNRLMAVAVQPSGDRLDVSLPTELFTANRIESSGTDDYAPGADGQRFLVKLPVEQDARPQLQVVTNWTSLLR